MKEELKNKIGIFTLFITIIFCIVGLTVVIVTDLIQGRWDRISIIGFLSAFVLFVRIITWAI